MGTPIKANDVRPSTKVEIDGELYTCTKYEHHKPGKGNTIVRLKLKHLQTGRVIDKTCRPEEGMEKVSLEPKEVQYLYSDTELHFMDNETFEQIALPVESLFGNEKWLIENMNLTLLYYDGNPVDVEIPMHMEMKVIQTDPGLKGDTVSGATKPATLESGVVINVPLFINEGDVLKIDTRDGGSYIERAKN